MSFNITNKDVNDALTLLDFIACSEGYDESIRLINIYGLTVEDIDPISDNDVTKDVALELYKAYIEFKGMRVSRRTRYKFGYLKFNIARKYKKKITRMINA